jgi:hypothetical protein
VDDTSILALLNDDDRVWFNLINFDASSNMDDDD